MAKIWERFYPLLFAVISGGMVCYFKWTISDINNFDLILNAAVTVSSIIIAFLGTMIAILITLTSSRVMQKIKDNNAQSLLTSYISQTIVAGLILAIYSIALFIFLDHEGSYSNLLLLVFVFFLTFLFFSAFRIMYLTSKILKSVLNEQETWEIKDVIKPSINKK